MPNIPIPPRLAHRFDPSGCGFTFDGAIIAALLAVVLTVRVVVPLPVIVPALKLQLVPLGKPEQADAGKLTVPLYPLTAVIVITKVAAVPGFTVWLVGLAVRL
jgi:hypothetical protein